MVNKDQFRSAANKAIENVIKHGDTDIFPFPFENRIIFDEKEKVADLINEYDNNFDEYLARYSPLNISSLTPVSYTGFRWATQIDPIWNVYFLACVIALATKIEAARLPKGENTVYSYRYKPNKATGDLFDRNYGWYQFMERSIDLSKQHGFVVACDISEFYPRLGHHRLENALKQVAGETPYPKRLMDFLSNFSNTRSFGLPVGGPAARLLSELTINQIDRLLVAARIKFCRFADDFHMFADSREEAYKNLIFISEKLFDNQGLSLQKSKTRIMTSSEFISTNPISTVATEIDAEHEGQAAAEQHNQLGQFLRFSLRFDPYSATAKEDYQKLKTEIRRFDVIGILKEELAKSRVHTALAKKVVSAIQYLDDRSKNDAVLSILENCDVLYPIYSSVLTMLGQVYSSLAAKTQNELIDKLRSLIESQTHIFRVDVHLSYALRVLAQANTTENQSLLHKLYEERTSPIIRRDIIIILANWGDWYWVSDLRNRFRQISGAERRAFIAASYTLKDEGDHWRKYIRDELNPFEKLVMEWSGKKANRANWEIPL